MAKIIFLSKQSFEELNLKRLKVNISKQKPKTTQIQNRPNAKKIPQ